MSSKVKKILSASSAPYLGVLKSEMLIFFFLIRSTEWREQRYGKKYIFMNRRKCGNYLMLSVFSEVCQMYVVNGYFSLSFIFLYHLESLYKERLYGSALEWCKMSENTHFHALPPYPAMSSSSWNEMKRNYFHGSSAAFMKGEHFRRWLKSSKGGGSAALWLVLYATWVVGAPLCKPICSWRNFKG